MKTVLKITRIWTRVRRNRRQRRFGAVVPVCACVEADIAELDDDSATGMAELGLEGSRGWFRVRAGYRLLNLQACFTASGVKEVRAWTVRLAQPRRRGR